MSESIEREENSIGFVIKRKVVNNCDLTSWCPPKVSKSNADYLRIIRKQIGSVSAAKIFSYMFPLFPSLRTFYNKRCLLYDILAGLTVSSLHVPQGMAYGQLAGLKPINGIYTSFFPAIIYLLFGASRHISIGTFSVMSLLVAEPVHRLSTSAALNNQTVIINDIILDEFRLKVGITVTVIVGIMQFLMGIFRLGLLVTYLSPALLGGFTCGAAMHVFASQLNGLFGIHLQRFTGPGRLIFTVQSFCYTVTRTNLVTMLLSAICISVLAMFKFYINPRVYARIGFPVPIEFILLTATTIISYFMQLNEVYGVTIAGTLPKGLPSPKVPDFSLTTQVWLDCAVASSVSVATTMSIIKLYATRYAYSVEYTREMSALGLANIFGGFFQCHACSGGLARTSVAVGAGMQSQVATIVSCSLLLFVLTCLGPLLRTLPLCVLSSIITVSLKGILVQILDLPKLYRTSVNDLMIWIVGFLATVLVDIPYGLLAGLCFSLITIIYRTHTAEHHVMGQVPGTNLYLSKDRFDGTETLSGMVLLQTTGPIYYANVDSFKSWVIRSVGINPYIERPGKVEQLHAVTETNQRSNSSALRFRRCFYFWKQSNMLQTEVHEWKERELKERWNVEHTEDDILERSSQTLRFIILDMSGCHFTDSVGAGVLCEMISKYRDKLVEVLLCCCSWNLRNTIINSGKDVTNLDQVTFPTMHDAVLYALSFSHKTDQPIEAVNDRGDASVVRTRI